MRRCKNSHRVILPHRQQQRRHYSESNYNFYGVQNPQCHVYIKAKTVYTGIDLATQLTLALGKLLCLVDVTDGMFTFNLQGMGNHSAVHFIRPELRAPDPRGS